MRDKPYFHRGGHFIEKCSCGRMIAQCRCPGPKVKIVIQDGCEECKKTAARPQREEEGR